MSKKEKNTNIEEKKIKKNKKDIGSIATRVMALVLALLMLLSIAGTLIFYLVMG